MYNIKLIGLIILSLFLLGLQANSTNFVIDYYYGNNGQLDNISGLSVGSGIGQNIIGTQNDSLILQESGVYYKVNEETTTQTTVTLLSFILSILEYGIEWVTLTW